MMNAILLNEAGRSLDLGKREIPHPSSGEILIKVTSAGLNPHDQKSRDEGFFVTYFPYVLGNDVAGVVQSIGPNVTDMQIGDHVFGQTNFLKRTPDQAALQEYAVLDAYTTAHVPPSFSDDDGVSLPTNAVAAFWALFGELGLNLPPPFKSPAAKTFEYAAHDIVIIGGGSNVGRYAVQFARLAGFRNIVVVASTNRKSELEAYGATHVINRHGADVALDVREIVGDSLLYALNAVDSDHTLGVRVLSESAKGVLVSVVGGEVDRSKVGLKAMGREERLSHGASHNAPELAAQFWKHLPEWMAEGRVKPLPWTVIEGLDVARVNSTLDDYRDGKAVEKQVHVHP